jgi:hypothetical protein
VPRRWATWGPGTTAAICAAVLTGCTSDGSRADRWLWAACTRAGDGQPPVVTLERGKPARRDDLVLGDLLVVLPIKPRDPVRDVYAGQGSPLVPTHWNDSGNSFFRAVRLGSTKLVEGGVTASVHVVCHLT